MILHVCDFCGAETSAGTNLRFQSLSVEPKLTKRWKDSGHTATRQVHVAVHIGIDGINPEPEHPDHAACDACQRKVLLQVLRFLEDDS